MKRYDAIVIGAGISGLSLASYTADAGLSTLVIEKSGRAGGCFHSHRFEGEAAGFWLELGAHTCYNSYGGLIGLLEQRGLIGSILAREKVSFKMLIDNEIRSITSQLSFLELAASAWRLFTLKKEAESVSSYYGRIVGRGNYDRVFAAAFNAVISQRADDFPADMLFNKRPRRKDIIKSFTLQGGVSSITDKICAIAGVSLITEALVNRISKSGARFVVELSDGRTFESDRLVLATPPPEASRLAAEIAPELSEVLSRIKVETVETVGVAVLKEKLKLPPVAGIIAVNDDFYSAVSRDTVPHATWRGFSFHFKSQRLSHEAKLDRIASVLHVTREDLDQSAQRESSLPSPVVGHGRLTEQIDGSIAAGNLFVTGNYFAGMAVEDCIVRSRGEFARLRGTL